MASDPSTTPHDTRSNAGLTKVSQPVARTAGPRPQPAYATPGMLLTILLFSLTPQ